MSYTTVVASTASELAPLQYIAPYAGCAIGEEWMEAGQDVLIVYDDLRDHQDVKLIQVMYSTYTPDC